MDDNNFDFNKGKKDAIEDMFDYIEDQIDEMNMHISNFEPNCEDIEVLEARGRLAFLKEMSEYVNKMR